MTLSAYERAAGRTRESVAAGLRAMADGGELAVPLPGAGRTRQRWAALESWGRRDLSLARLAEGHVDAVAILAEAGRTPVPDALYGVWASHAGGSGARLHRGAGGWSLTGTVRFCSGARCLDRALVSAGTDDGDLLVEVDLREPRVQPDPESWPAIGMDASDSVDVTFDDLPVPDDAIIGEPGFYTGRPGFAVGGAGVAAVWLGGAARALDDAVEKLRGQRTPDVHKLAHVGAVHTALAEAGAVLVRAASDVDRDPRGEHTMLAETCRSAAERAATETLNRVPSVLGPGPLCWDRAIAQHLADLQVYVRQHHGERDRAELGRRVLDRGAARRRETIL